MLPNSSIKKIQNSDQKILVNTCGKQILKITFNDDDIDKFQNILTNQFWKLNENESNPEGKLEEAMTVHLTDESKTVSGKEPNNERYTFIKDSLFEQIDSGDYESWQD